MAIVASLAIAGVVTLCALLVSLLVRDLRSRERAWERKEASWAIERKDLINRIMFLAERPWEVPDLGAEPQQAEEEWEADVLDLPLDGPLIDYETGPDLPHLYPLNPVQRV